MNIGILIGTILIEIVIIGGVSLFLSIRNKHAGADDFVSSGRNMPMIAVAATQALTALGGGHIMGMPGASWSFGVGAYWYIISSGIMLIIMLCFTGPWIRRFKFTTITQLFERMFNRKVAIIMSGMAAGTAWGVMTLELQGVGTIIAALTGWNVIIGCIIGGVIALLYVIFGGMTEVGWVNVFNAIFMYVGAFIAIGYIGSQLPNGWQGVNEYYQNQGNDWMLSIWANADTWKVYIIGTILAQLFYCPIGPQAAQVSASAKNVNAIRKSVLFAVPMNCIFGAIMIALGMAAKSIPEFEMIGAPPMANFQMLISLLPGWLVAWLFAAFSAAMLSTIAVQILALSTIFVHDIYVPFYKRNNVSDKQKLKYLRVAVVIFAATGTALSLALPEVQNAIVWLFAWLLPAFWLFVFGMFWKRSNSAALWTLIISGIFNMIWSFTSLPTMLHLDGNNNSIGLIVVSLLLSVILTGVDKNAGEPFIRMYKRDKSLVVNPEYESELTGKRAQPSN